jgi:hypothetical protein
MELDELKVPKGLRPVVDEIVGVTDARHPPVTPLSSELAGALRPAR